jgi:AraC family transcriptional regulator
MDRPAAADYPAGARLPLRVIDDFELVWMLRGRATFVLEDGSEHALVSGRLLLVPRGVRHGFHWDPARPSRHGYVHFGLHDVATALPQDFRLVQMTDDDPLAGLCAYLLWLAGRHSWQAPARQTLEYLIALVVAGPLPDQHPPRPPAGLSTALGVLRREWARPPLRRIDVAELAERSALSRGHLTRLFRAEFGLGPAAALTRLRCARAETLLTRTDLSAEAVAHQCGFADLSHFSHRFNALHGVPPSSYRTFDGLHPSVLDHPGMRRLARLIWT